MKKRIIAFMCAMMAMLMVTGAVFATTKNESIDVGSSTYDKAYTGSSSYFRAMGNSSQAYTILQNTASSSRYLTCQVREYKANIGWGQEDEDLQTYPTGMQTQALISRSTSIVGYYMHSGACYASEYSGQVYDNYTFKAYQQQEIQ